MDDDDQMCVFSEVSPRLHSKDKPDQLAHEWRFCKDTQEYIKLDREQDL